MDIYRMKLDDKVLFLGEGNFSFCVDYIKYNLDLLTKEHSHNDSSAEIIASCFESNDNISDIKIRNIKFLKEKGVNVLFSIDATKLKDSLPIGCKNFTKVIFNFPHVGGKMKIHLNRKLLAEFFMSSKDVLNENGVVLLTLCDGQGGTDADTNKRRWDDTWKVVEMAAESGFSLRNVYPFLHNFFPGYINTGFRSMEKEFNSKEALTHVFQIGKCFKNMDNSAIDSLFNTEKIVVSFTSEEVSKVYSKKILQSPFKNELSPQSCLYDMLKRVDFHKITFCDDIDLVYGFGCTHASSCDLIKKYLTSYMDFTNTIGVFKAYSLNKLTSNFLQQPVSCEIICVGNDSSIFAKQAICKLMDLFNSSAKLRQESHSEENELFFIDNSNRFDILNVSKSLSIKNDFVDVCTIHLDNLAMFLFDLHSWHELWAEGTIVNIIEGKGQLLTPCLYPCTNTFDLSLSAQGDFTEERFSNILWHVAGNIIFNVFLISTYQPSNSTNKHFCYRIRYKSYEVPLSRKQVIQIQSNYIGKTLERFLNVKVL